MYNKRKKPLKVLIQLKTLHFFLHATIVFVTLPFYPHFSLLPPILTPVMERNGGGGIPS